MKPVVKVLIVVAIVLITVHIIKGYDRYDGNDEPYVPFPRQEFETVAPIPFIVTPVPLTVDAALGASSIPVTPFPVPTTRPVLQTMPPVLAPVLTQVGTQQPAVVPTMVPTFVPNTLTTTPVLITTRAP